SGTPSGPYHRAGSSCSSRHAPFCGSNIGDDSCPNGSDCGGQYEFVPDVHEQNTIDIGENVGRSAFTYHYFVDPGALAPVAQVVTAPAIGPVQVQGEFDRCQGFFRGEPG